MLITEGFQQVAPDLNSASWTEDAALNDFLLRTLPQKTYAAFDKELAGFQQRLAGPIHDAALLADGVDEEPTLMQYDQWGVRKDLIRTSEGWRRLKLIAAEEGLVSTPMAREYSEHSRTLGFVKAMMLGHEGRYVGCPMAMTDGAARLLELYGTPQMQKDVLPHLVSTETNEAWTAGQWMTERPGGSDVSMTETVATPCDSTKTPEAGDWYTLDGFKWFSSAADGEISLALARTGEKGSRGLSLFLIKIRDARGKLNGIQIHRLKKKWGTKSLPTAELSLEGCVAQLVGKPGRGVATISTMLNITRMWSSISGIGALRRCLVIAKAFARVRKIGGEGGTLLSENDMHTSSLLRSEVVHRALLQMSYSTIELLGKSEVQGDGKMPAEERWRLRLLTPVAKSFCADLATKEMLSLMEALGGQGYMTENEMGRLLADAAVEKIWEGTTNTMGLDVVRVLKQSRGGAIDHFKSWITRIIDAAQDSSGLAPLARAMAQHLEILSRCAKAVLQPNSDPRLPTQLLFLLGYITSATNLLEQALWSHQQAREKSASDQEVLRIWLDNGGLRQVVHELEWLLGGDEAISKKSRDLHARIVYNKARL